MIPVFPITLDAGEGAVLTESIASVLPCLKRGFQNRCLIFTMAHPEGLEIHGTVDEVSNLWYTYMTMDPIGDDEEAVEAVEAVEVVEE